MNGGAGSGRGGELGLAGPVAADSDGPPDGRFEYTLPSLGADMESGRIVEWLVAVGDEVRRGDVVAVVETEKSDIDVEIWHDGVVEAILASIGEEVAVGAPIALLRPGVAAAAQSGDEGGEIDDIDGTVDDRPPPVNGRIPASPLARRLAARRGVDLAFVVGTGPGGAVVSADIEALDARPAYDPAAAPRHEDVNVDPMRSLIAERMSEANREIPHYYLSRDIDLSAMLGWLERENEGRPISERLLPAALYLKATAIAAAQHREMNGFWTDGAFVAGEAVNVAMAVSLRRGGLVTPQVASADERSVIEIMATLREFVMAARTGSLRGSWMTGATITLTNLGDRGADRVYGVISPPQVALVGTGAIQRRAWVVDDEVAVRPILTVTLAADHRATDGNSGGRFLTTLATALEHPERL